MRKLNCLRCSSRMKFGMREKFQLGQHSAIFGDWPHLIAGSLELEVWFCPKCGKAEFFVPEGETRKALPEENGDFDFVDAMVNQDIDSVDDEGMPQKKCPTCGKEHDFDYPKCPYCKHDYNAK